jgi:uncharacterized protein (DUF2062 family)
MKKTIRRYMPNQQHIRTHKHLRIFGSLMHDPNLWHLNRRSVSGAFAVGLFMAYVPVPFQMVLAAAAAIPCRVNLPISVGLVWISNPLTMPPMFFLAYKLGAQILGTDTSQFTFELSYEWLMSGFLLIWQPFLLGCLLFGIAGALLGYLIVRVLWRLHVVSHIKQRRTRRKSAKASPDPVTPSDQPEQ